MEEQEFRDYFTLPNGIHTVMKAGRNIAGMTLIELMVALALIGVAFMALANSTQTSLIHFKRSLRETYATEIAIERMEELSAMNPLDIPAGVTAENISRGKVGFTRTVEVTVNVDRSRAVSISVTGHDPKLGGRCSISSTLPLREAG